METYKTALILFPFIVWWFTSNDVIQKFVLKYFKGYFKIIFSCSKCFGWFSSMIYFLLMNQNWNVENLFLILGCSCFISFTSDLIIKLNELIPIKIKL